MRIDDLAVYLTPCVGWYSPPEVSVASERKFEITVLPLCEENSETNLSQTQQIFISLISL